jgi:uncharacterized protein (DUF1778 family)
MPATNTPTTPRTARFGLRATVQQETILRRAAEVSRKSLTEFILDSACAMAEQTLLEQRLFLASGQQYQTLLELLDRPPQANAGLEKLFTKTAPWEQ